MTYPESFSKILIQTRPDIQSLALSYAFHSHSDQVKNWVEKHLIEKFSKGKHQNLHLGRNNTVHIGVSLAGKQKRNRQNMDPQAKQASCILGWIRESIASRSREMTLPLCSALVRHTWSVFRIPQHKEDTDILKKVQQKKNMMDWSISPMRKGWQSWNYSLEKDQGDFTSWYIDDLMDARQGSQAAFSVTGHSGHRLKQTHDTPGEHKNPIFLLWVWSNTDLACSREVLESPSFEILKIQRDMDLTCSGWPCWVWTLSSCPAA